MLNLWLETNRRFGMIQKGDRLLAAVSGGCDSSVLLHLLNELKKEWKLSLCVIHVNHGLRGKASDGDEQFVRQISKKLNLPFRAAHVSVEQKAKSENLSLEEAAHALRYEAFEKTAKAERISKIVLAHSRDDQAETVLMRLLQGTGLQGLQAIRPKLKRNGFEFVRPMIEISRREIREFARLKKIKFREDVSNESVRFLRNRIRLKLIPEIERSFNPQVKKILARLPYLLDFDLSFLEETAGRFYQTLAKEGNCEISFSQRSFALLHPAIQYRLLSRAARKLARAEIDFDHWNEFLNRFSGAKRFQLQFPKNLLVSVTSEIIRIAKPKNQAKLFSYFLNLGDSIDVPEIGAKISCEEVPRPKRLKKTDKSFEFFDLDKLSFPLEIRARKAGDRFQPLGQSKPLRLKGYLMNQHIPREKRSELPVFISKNEIFWVGMTAINECAKINSDTKRVVKIRIWDRHYM